MLSVLHVKSKKEMPWLGAYLVLCVITVALAAELPYDTKHPHITTLNVANFGENVIQNDAIWVVEFYAPWCGHCKSFAPEFEKAAKSLEGIVRFGAVNADDKNAKQIANTYKVHGYPMVYLFPTDPVEVEGGQFTKKPIQYKQPRKALNLVRWALSMMPTKHIAKIVDEEAAQAFVSRHEEDQVPKVLLFSNKKTIAQLYIALSLDFKYRALFGFVPPDSSADRLREKYNIKKFPTILKLGDDEAFHTYEGEITKGPLTDFVTSHALPPSSRATLMQKFLPTKKAEAKKREDNAPRPILINTTENWKKICVERVGICAVAFLDESDSGYERQLRTLDEVLKELPWRYIKVSVQFVIVDGPANREIAKFFESGENGYPSMVFVQPKSSRFLNMEDAFTDDNIVSFVASQVVNLDSDLPGRGKLDKVLLGSGRYGKAYKSTEIPVFVERRAEVSGLGGDKKAVEKSEL